jgi:hypothetical protein
MRKRIFLNEEEYFDRYYPKELGDWRKEYDIKACREGKIPGVYWMCYRQSGIASGENPDTGKMEIIPWRSVNPRFVRSGFLQMQGPEIGYLCPYKTGDGKEWAQITVRREESNLSLYVIRIAGCDDASYSVHVLEEGKAIALFDEILHNGVDDPDDMQLYDAFFTN